MLGEFHTQLQLVSVSGSMHAARRTRIPHHPDALPFTNRRGVPTQTSVLGEGVVVDGEGRVWLSQISLIDSWAAAAEDARPRLTQANGSALARRSGLGVRIGHAIHSSPSLVDPPRRHFGLRRVAAQAKLP